MGAQRGNHRNFLLRQWGNGKVYNTHILRILRHDCLHRPAIRHKTHRSHLSCARRRAEDAVKSNVFARLHTSGGAIARPTNEKGLSLDGGLLGRRRRRGCGGRRWGCGFWFGGLVDNPEARAERTTVRCRSACRRGGASSSRRGGGRRGRWGRRNGAKG